MSARSPLPFLSQTGRAATPIAFAHGILAAYRHYGCDPADALEKAHIPPDLLADPSARITAAQFEILSEAAMRELDDEALGWFSRPMPWGAYGLLCRASITAPDLGVALKRWRRHHLILSGDIAFDLAVDGEDAILAIEESRDIGLQREYSLVKLVR